MLKWRVPRDFPEPLPDFAVIELFDRDSQFPYGFWVTGRVSDRKGLAEIHAWCAERFGEPGTIWMPNRTDVWFADQLAAMEFKLRWV